MRCTYTIHVCMHVCMNIIYICVNICMHVCVYRYGCVLGQLALAVLPKEAEEALCLFGEMYRVRVTPTLTPSP